MFSVVAYPTGAEAIQYPANWDVEATVGWGRETASGLISQGGEQYRGLQRKRTTV
ncbi:MAG: hypothetical protein OXE78_04290 [Gammaproteobacteria bacterium]|nr:hypothetical protein [Gammaproteobacteria bacterium]MCY4358123.1 hypothetical protein [Gammaproteobacteria bacterium]